MKNLKKFDVLLHTEVNRKEFLRYLGIIGLTIIGFSGMLQNLDKLGSSQVKHIKAYGSSAYGE